MAIWPSVGQNSMSTGTSMAIPVMPYKYYLYHNGHTSITEYAMPIAMGYGQY